MTSLMNTLVGNTKKGDIRSLARCISLVENESPGYMEILKSLEVDRGIPIIGITGPPGAGKSTIVNSLIGELSRRGKKTGVLAIDPTSPFNYGSLLGDRIRMSAHFNDPNVFIRSLATRGSLGGLSAKTIEISDLMRSFPFDYILIETVGVGQSEVEIVGLADTTVVVLVPEAGDEIQGIKSGVMEIADIFVVNKADREGADQFVNNLYKILHEKEARAWQVPVIKTVAIRDEGTEQLLIKITEHGQFRDDAKKELLLVEKAYRLIQNHRMQNVDREKLRSSVREHISAGTNFYTMLEKFF